MDLRFLYALGFASLAWANDAVRVNTNTQNGKHVEEAITEWGSDWHYAICSCMGATTIGILGASYLKRRSDRIFFYLCATICMIACVAYYAMGSNLVWTPIDVEWLRSILGFLTTPLLLLDLMLTAGLPWPSIGWTIMLDEVMVVTGLLGALTKTRYKWGFYAFGCAAMFKVFWELAVVARRNAKLLGNDVHRVFLMRGVWTLCIWALYPISWGLSEGGNVITPNDEAVFYDCLDFCAKPVFSIALIWGHWNIAPHRLGLAINNASEKPVETNGGATNGHVANGDGVVQP